jgi:hypothetical protein
MTLVSATTASATVRVFVTPSSSGYGLEDHVNAFVPTASAVDADNNVWNGFDYENYYTGVPGPLRPGAYPPADSPSGTCDDPILIPEGDFAYIWLQFQGEPKLQKIRGLLVEISFCGTGVVPPSVANPGPGQVYSTYYLCNNMSHPLIGTQRWNGTATPPDYPEWHNNPQTMLSVTAYGMVNHAVDVAWNLWKGGTWCMALLGAVTAPADGATYAINITNIGYATGDPPTLAGGVFQFLPEPAGWLLMGLGGLLLRRR